MKKQLPFGCIVATATLVACLPVERCDAENQVAETYFWQCIEREGRREFWGRQGSHVNGVTCEGELGRVEISKLEYGFGNYEERKGRFAWLLGDIQPLPEPIPYRGRQRIFKVEMPEVLHV